MKCGIDINRSSLTTIALAAVHHRSLKSTNSTWAIVNLLKPLISIRGIIEDLRYATSCSPLLSSRIVAFITCVRPLIV